VQQGWRKPGFPTYVCVADKERSRNTAGWELIAGKKGSGAAPVT